LKTLYRALFRSGQNVTEAAAGARKIFSSPGAKVMLDFIAASKRGVCADSGVPRGNEDI
jgi:acyl-[acyl carrier protein]--UDP-N-acetylglucosamine O-acyltransferase